ncbi:GNAT family N-acetyltransferase [Telmatospirillum siberiense]|uniref:N-acetyltransferase domain-containing protein n=1 Tax=Telmatospirillum siberiense TaxID=382514 RepID=A0A2N3PZP3_9PROT|nr:GNAT family N-acetyltransferase [Telmatospirillum siberiense]PKU25882.1 hypothetical protein CWS72_04825 [Telmatospirillum siberiense]
MIAVAVRFERELAAAVPSLASRPADAAARALIDAMVAEDFIDRCPGLPDGMAADMAMLQVRARRDGYRRQYSHAGPADGEALLTLDREPVGHWWVLWQADLIHLVDLALCRSMRGRGLGTALLAAVCAAADGEGLPVTLSVSPANPAQRLYRRLGFAVEEGGEQPAFLAMRRPPRAFGRNPAG